MNPQSQWQFAGSVPENYERYLVPSIFAPWADDLVELAALHPSDRVLDIACGTGIVARRAVRKVGVGGSVVGLNLSAPMLAAARATAANEGVSVEWREGSAAMLPLSGEAFDAVFCQQGLQFFPDRPAALREMYRVLTVGGRVVVSVWREIEHSLGFAVLAQALARHVGPETGALMTFGPFALSDTQELRALIAGAGFRDITIRPVVKTLRYPSPDEFVLQYAAGSALAGAVAGADNNAWSALLAEIRVKLESYVDDQRLAFPIESNIAMARR